MEIKDVTTKEIDNNLSDPIYERVKEVYNVEDPKVINLCIKRLGLTTEAFDSMIDIPPKTFFDYPNLLTALRLFSPFVATLAKLQLIPKSTYAKYCGGVI